ncbi:MAG: hypothetical protein M3R00_08195 [Pseudomonadota bacterium]|nr:hypothetical protein [Pseudomonadota bacterium]
MKAKTNTKEQNIEKTLRLAVDALTTKIGLLIKKFPNLEGPSDFSVVESLLKLAINNKKFTFADVKRRIKAHSRDQAIWTNGQTCTVREVFPQNRRANMPQMDDLLKLFTHFDPTDSSKNIPGQLLNSILQCIHDIANNNAIADCPIPFVMCLRSFSSADIQAILESSAYRYIWNEVMVPIRDCLHNFAGQDLTTLELTDADLFTLSVKGKEICAKNIAEKIHPYIRGEDTIAGQQKVMSAHMGYYIDNAEQRFSASHIVRTLLVASANVLIRKRFNQTICPLEQLECVTLKFDSDIAVFNWKFAHKSIIVDHSESRIRHQLSRVDAKNFKSKKYNHKHVQAAITIQRFVKKLTRSNNIAKMKVNNISGDHSDLAHHMIALEANLRKSMNITANAEFLRAMQTSQWHRHEMFQTVYYQHCAIAAMLAGKISTDQCGTLLRWRSANAITSTMATYSILATEDVPKVESHEQKLGRLRDFASEFIRVLDFIENTDPKEEDLDLELRARLDEATGTFRSANNIIPPLLEQYMMKTVTKYKEGTWKTDPDMRKDENLYKDIIWAVTYGHLTLNAGTYILQWFDALKEREIQSEQPATKLLEQLDILENKQQKSLKMGQDAIKLLYPWLQRTDATNKQINAIALTHEQIQKFIELVAELPPSERIFYHFTVGQRAKSAFLFTNTAIIELSEGAKAIYNMIAYGKHAAKCDLRFGHFGTDDIEKSERDSLRPGAIATVNSKQTINVHDEDVTQYEADYHDNGHAVLLSSFSLQPRNLIFVLADVFRNVSGYKWSKALWNIVDFAFPSVEADRKLTTEQTFALPIFKDFMPVLFQLEAMIFGEPKRGSPKNLFWALIIDMLKHPLKWQFHGVDVNNLTSDLAQYYQFAHKHYDLIRNDSDIIAVIKLTVFFENRNDDVAKLNHMLEGKLLNPKFVRANLRKIPLLGVQVNGAILDDITDADKLSQAVGLSQNPHRFAMSTVAIQDGNVAKVVSENKI